MYFFPASSNVAPTENLLPNTQWQVASGLLSDTKFNKEGTGLFPSIDVISYSINDIGSVSCIVGASGIGDLKVNDIGVFSAAAHINLKICSCRVISIATDNTSFTVSLPLGLTGNTSAVCTFTPISSGGNNSNNTGDAFDGWSKSVNAIVWRDDYSVNLKNGSIYSLGFKKSSISTEYLYVDIPIRELNKYRGRKVVFGTWVMHKIKNGTGTWRVAINTSSINFLSIAASYSTWQWLEISGVVPLDTSSLFFSIEFLGTVGDVYYVSQPMTSFGQSLGFDSYSQPRDEYLIPRVHIQSKSFLNGTISMPSSLSSSTGKGNDTQLVGNNNSAFKVFAVDIYAETNGAIAPTIRELIIKTEGRCVSETDGFCLSNNNTFTGAHVFGPTLISVRGGFMMSPQKAGVPLDINGLHYVFTPLIPLTGTLDFTNGLAAVNGVGTRFLSELSNGMLIKVNTNSGNKFYRVKSRASDTALTLGVPGGADATFDEATALGVGALKINANWFNFSTEVNGVILS